jgi:hypothetical protein
LPVKSSGDLELRSQRPVIQRVLADWDTACSQFGMYSGTAMGLSAPTVDCADHPGIPLDHIMVNPQQISAGQFQIEHQGNLLGGISILRGAATVMDESDWTGKTLSSYATVITAHEIKAIPYYAWSNREPGEMRVWIQPTQTWFPIRSLIWDDCEACRASARCSDWISSHPARFAIVRASFNPGVRCKNPAACYVVLEATGNDLSVEFRRVPYDTERATQAIEASEMPNEFAQMLRTRTG